MPSGLDIGIILGSLALFIFGVYFMMAIFPKLKKRWKESQFDYKTKQGVLVKRSPLLKSLTQEEMEAWLDDIASFWVNAKKLPGTSLWAQAYGLPETEVKKALEGIEITFHDAEYLVSQGRKVNGFANPNMGYRIEIAALYKQPVDPALYTPFKKSKSLVRHEVSHMILERVAVKDPFNIPFDETIHHQLFKELNLGA